MFTDTNLNSAKTKILIIDDEQDICFLLSSLLKRKNFEVHYVNSLSEADQEFDNQQPKLVFLDHNLPDGKGIDFIDIIKERSKDAKIIMITAYDTSLDKTRALEHGADYFLGKPFSKEMVYSAVDAVLD